MTSVIGRCSPRQQKDVVWLAVGTHAGHCPDALAVGCQGWESPPTPLSTTALMGRLRHRQAVHSQVALLAPGPSIQPGKSSQWTQAFSQPPSAGRNRKGPFLEPAQCLAHGKHLVNFARLKKNDSPKHLSEGPHSTSPFLRSLASTD